jgi:hypothetical protein
MTAITIAGTTNRIDSFYFAVAASSPTLAAAAISSLGAASLRWSIDHIHLPG